MPAWALDCGKVLGLEDRHRQGMSRARRVTEQIDAAAIDVLLIGEEFHQIMQEVRSVFRNAPAFGRCRVWRGEDDAFFFRERSPRIDERLAVAAGPVQKDQQRRDRRRRLGNEEVIGSRASARSESLDGHLVCGRSRRRNYEREEASDKYFQLLRTKYLIWLFRFTGNHLLHRLLQQPKSLGVSLEKRRCE